MAESGTKVASGLLVVVLFSIWVVIIGVAIENQNYFFFFFGLQYPQRVLMLCSIHT